MFHYCMHLIWKTEFLSWLCIHGTFFMYTIVNAEYCYTFNYHIFSCRIILIFHSFTLLFEFSSCEDFLIIHIHKHTHTCNSLHLDIYNVVYYYNVQYMLIKFNSLVLWNKFNVAKIRLFAKVFQASKGANSRVDDRMGRIVDWVEWH